MNYLAHYKPDGFHIYKSLHCVRKNTLKYPVSNLNKVINKNIRYIIFQSCNWRAGTIEKHRMAHVR